MNGLTEKEKSNIDMIVGFLTHLREFKGKDINFVVEYRTGMKIPYLARDSMVKPRDVMVKK